MVNKTQEALKMAIDDLELCNGAQTVEDIIIYTHEAIKACKEALAELEQQPKVTGFIRTLETVDKDGIETWKLEPFFTLQSLQEHDNEVIERCAKVCEKVDETTVECPELAIYCAEAIRALKGKQNES